MVEEKDLNRFKVVELKSMLQQHGVTPKGLKMDLVKQLYGILKAREEELSCQQQQSNQEMFQNSEELQQPLQSEESVRDVQQPEMLQQLNEQKFQVEDLVQAQQGELSPQYENQMQQINNEFEEKNDSLIVPKKEETSIIMNQIDNEVFHQNNIENQPENDSVFKEDKTHEINQVYYDEGEEADIENNDILISEEELSKMSKNQRRKYKKKMRNKIKRQERQMIEIKRRELMPLKENKLQSKSVEIKEETAEDDAMDIDDEDEAEEEKEKRLREEQEAQKTQNCVLETNDKLDVTESDVEIEYVPEEIPNDPVYLQFLKVFDKFSAVSPSEASRLEAERLHEQNKNRDDRTKLLELKKPVELELKEDDEKDNDGLGKLSKRKMKQLNRMSIADLKQNVTHPELVEMHDVTARDPVLLLQLKSTRNTVPVPRHWCYKRKYLQGKRGFEKPPFKLPEFIRRTGIQEMREALQEKEDTKSLKSKMKEKIRPKMGKIDIDYQKLHDAFFKWQTKPKMTIHGDLYYEGKEFETRLKDKKPGELTTELRSSLGMPTGPNANKCPPPWLIAMQRYGPPPSYPNMKIPGLNAPIPDGCSFGYHAGGWGKPPVDEYGRPLYGDVFGLTLSAGDITLTEINIDKTRWGEIESEEEEEVEESEEEEEEEEEDADVNKSGLVTPAAEGLVTPSGISSVPTGIETPDMIELRKRKQAIEAEMESGENPALFTVIPEQKTDRYGKDMMGSMHVYDFASLSKTSSKSSSHARDGIDVALDPSELESGGLDSNQLSAKYEQSMRKQSGGNPHEDLSDMVAEYAAANKPKRKKGDHDANKSSKDKSKKYQFKF
ncbi:Splicing factor 3B subunit 2 [Blomia tropicalis]|nr:Splicing factor 3B subunit 2 [Blomia tropicalis]